jgi:hypothetical protein
VQDRHVLPFLESALCFCNVVARGELEDDASRACVASALVASVSLAAGLMPLVAACLDRRDSAMLGRLDEAVMQLASVVVQWEAARESVEEHVLQPGILLTWLQAFGVRETGAPRGVLQLASCMLAPLCRGGGGGAVVAAGGGSWRGADPARANQVLRQSCVSVHACMLRTHGMARSEPASLTMAMDWLRQRPFPSHISCAPILMLVCFRNSRPASGHSCL